jgi:hypothetical protein
MQDERQTMAITLTASVEIVEGGYQGVVKAEMSNGQKSEWRGKVYKSRKLAEKDTIKELEYAKN